MSCENGKTSQKKELGSTAVRSRKRINATQGENRAKKLKTIDDVNTQPSKVNNVTSLKGITSKNVCLDNSTSCQAEEEWLPNKSVSKGNKSSKSAMKTAVNEKKRVNTNELKPSKRQKVSLTKKPTAGTSGVCNDIDLPLLKLQNDVVKNQSIQPWKDEEYLAEVENLPKAIAKNIIQLLKEENTIPFIARYRKDMTGDLDPDKLRKVKATYDYINQVHSKAKQLIQQIQNKESLTPTLVAQIKAAKSIETLELIGAPYKKDSKVSLAERAKQLGLEEVAEKILDGKVAVNLESLVKPNIAGLEDVKKVKLGIQHIIADVISKSTEVHSLLEEIVTSGCISVKSKLKASKNKDKQITSKYDLYKDFTQSTKFIKPHQMLAINRGESEKELSVKIVIPEELWTPVRKYCTRRWQTMEKESDLKRILLLDSIDDAIKRLLSPFVTRRVRTKLNKDAEDEAINVFSSNLRQLLMLPPHRGKVVMGIDPGFRNGCKVAVVSPTGELLGFDKFFLNSKDDQKLQSLVSKYECQTIVLGNGVGCRETEAFLSDLIQRGAFNPLKVSYTIFSEQGVSIYSCSSVAKEEFPDLDPTFIGAVSLARRLQDPLSEFVKVEPTHLGVGMYQHDVGDKKLVSVLDEIVSECVSFVGVDINSASFYLLKRVAGLSSSKAQEIIKFRSSNCPFRTREDLKKVKGIKTKTFQQCAGFIRVIPSTARCQKDLCCKEKLNPLDQTCIHPESYDAAIKVTKLLDLKLEQLGKKEFIDTVKIKINSLPAETLAKQCQTSVAVINLIIDTLMKPKDFDLRSSSFGPIFRQGIQKMEDLQSGDNMTGVVRNVVPFGAFVDIGVGIDGLIHISQMGNKKLQLNDRVTVLVTSIDIPRKRIQLKLLSVMT